MRHPGRFRWAGLIGGLLAALTAVGASSPADKQAFLEQQRIYLSFEITESGAREFGTGTPKDALTDGAHRINRRVTFEVPLEMAIPGSFPPSSMPLSQTEMIEQGRFIAWMAAPPEDAAAEEALTAGKVELAGNPLFLPAEFSVDDVSQFRFRDTPSQGWGTQTTTTKGKGIVYLATSGMLSCDMKKMTCDINNVLQQYSEDKDLVTIHTTSDVPGFEPKQRTMAPGLHLPKLSASLSRKLSGFTITLPEPITLTFSGAPASAQGGDGEGSIITMKVTLSPKPAAKAAAASR